MTCTRPTCRLSVTGNHRGRPRRYCSDRCRIAVAKGITLPPSRGEDPPTSWWQGPDFYAEARRRFPVEPVGFAQRGWGTL